MASLAYTSFIRDVHTGAVDVDTDTFWGMLVTSAYTADKDHDKRDDITNEVTIDTGYVAGGKAVTLAVSLDTVNDRLNITCADITWAAANITNARGLVLYKRRGGAASADELVFYGDFLADKTSTGGDFVVNGMTTFAVRYQN